MTKLRWRMTLVAELGPGVITEAGRACIEGDEQATLADLGLTLAEAKQLTAAVQAAIVLTQMAAPSTDPRACAASGARLAAKGHYGATFRSLFGDVPVRVRRWFACPCQGASEAKGVAALVHHAARRQRNEPIAVSFVESAIDEIFARRMNKAQQMRWNRAMVQPFLDVRTAALNDTLDDAFRCRHRPDNLGFPTDGPA